MNSDPELKAALADLYRRHTFGIKLGLHVESALLERLGEPQRAYGVVHVAGTNGKGSVCALVESALRAAGLRTGLYTSPHLVRINERIGVAGQAIGDADLLSLIRDMAEPAQAVAQQLGQEPTFFEFVTALAFEHFRRKEVRIAVVEVGMGGRLDATNVVEPLASVITGIGLEHTAYLGPDLPAVTREKAGIIKKGRPVICGKLDGEALQVVRGIAAERGAPLILAPERVSVSLVREDIHGQKVRVESTDASYGVWQLPLAGRHQLDNLATAVAALETLQDTLGVPFDAQALRKGIEGAVWPGRFQVLQDDPVVIADGAHNPQAAGVLAESLERLLKRKPVGLVLGMCADKDVKGFLGAFRSVARRLWIVPVRSERNRPAEDIRAAAEGMGWDIVSCDLTTAMGEAEAWARQSGGAVCVTGSLFLVGEVLEMRGGSGGQGGGGYGGKTQG